jgi:hypothetical protein
MRGFAFCSSQEKKPMTNSSPKQSTNAPLTPGPHGRAVGLDVHPDSFAAATGQSHLNTQ